MIIPLTWLQYWKAVGIIAILYYVIILAMFFRGDIKKLLISKHRKKETPVEETEAA